MLQSATDAELAMMIQRHRSGAPSEAFATYPDQTEDDTLRDITSVRLGSLPPSVGAVLLVAGGSRLDFAALNGAMASADADAARNAFDAARHAVAISRDPLFEPRLAAHCPMYDELRQRW